MSDTSSSAAAPSLSLDKVLAAVGDPTRWRILRELSAGEPLMVKEIARAIGRSETVAAKHLAVLRNAGITQIARGRLQQIARPFLIDTNSRIVDLGYVQLRLGSGSDS